MNDSRIDPVTFEVLKNSLFSIAAEMKVVLAKTAYSPLLKSAGDYSCGLFSANGEMVAQGADLPIHLGSMPDAVKAVVKAFPQVEEGDVYIHNDPYFGGSHLPDVNVVTPAFYDGQLLGFGCVRAHWPDIGSATPGSYGAVTEIFGEGLRLPPVRLMHQDQIDRNVEAIILANVRTPEERRGDLSAQIAANRRAVSRLQSLAGKHGSHLLVSGMSEVLDYSERMMRSLIAALPDGTARFEDFLDGDGIVEQGESEDAGFAIRMQLRKQGDRLAFDFEGTDPQVRGPMNAPLSVTASGVYAGVKMVVDPGSLAPPNSGAWRPISVDAPEGSVLNARFPAPVVYANHEISHRVADLVFGAFSELVPERVCAGNQGTSSIITFGGEDPRNKRRYVSYETLKVGFAARAGKDGINAIATTISNTMNTPVEVLEMSFPLRVDYYELIPDSGGAGRFRGGLGTRRGWTVLDHRARAGMCLERTKSPPFGLFGGQPGSPARITVEDPHGVTQAAGGKGGIDVLPGGKVHVEAPGSGGFGPPSERKRDKLRDDVLNGYVSAEGVRRDYGVQLDDLLDDS